MAVEETVDAPEAPIRIDPAWKVKLLGFLVWLAASLIFATMRMRYELSDSLRHAVESKEGAILVTWHGRTLMPANAFRGRGWWALISLSRDGEIQNNIFGRFGFQTIRGSTGRGGVRAALQLARKIKEGGMLCFTPDGPRGPTHKVQPGTLFLAQRSGRPIIPVGISARPRALLPTWDSYLIPLPFSRGAIVSGDAIFVPADANDEEHARIAEEVGSAIDRVERRAAELIRIPPEAAT